MGTKIFDLVTMTLKFDLLFKKNSGTMTFESEGLLIFAIFIWLPPASYVVFLTTLVVTFILPFFHTFIACVNKNFNLGHNFHTRSDRAFILHLCIPCDKTFYMVP